MAIPSLANRLRVTPVGPGVYQMKDEQGRALYVGKAANLRSRLRSYFAPAANHEPKIRRMLTRVADYDFIVTDSPAEALILENTLIKKHRPPFNARLKDDKTYPYIKIDRAEEFPQIYITRRVENDGAVYFGPFATAHSIRKTLALLKKLFPYRSCTKVITGKDARPCLEYFINRCAAPCTGEIDKENYHKIIDQVVLFMGGEDGAGAGGPEEEDAGSLRQAGIRAGGGASRPDPRHRTGVGGAADKDGVGEGSRPGRHRHGDPERSGVSGGLLRPKREAHRSRHLRHGRNAGRPAGAGDDGLRQAVLPVHALRAQAHLATAQVGGSRRDSTVAAGEAQRSRNHPHGPARPEPAVGGVGGGPTRSSSFRRCG